MVKNGNIEIKRILDILKEKAVLIVFVLIVFTLLGYMYSYYYVVPEYKSTATLLLIPNNASEEQTITSTDLTLNSGLISTYSNIAKQSKVLKQVIKNLNLDMTEKELLRELKVNVIKDTYIIELTVCDIDPQRANDITRELSDVFLQEIKNIYSLENIGIVDEAELPTEPFNVNHILDIIIFFAIGMFISGIIVLGIIILDNTIKTEEDIESYIGLKSLGKIPVNLNKKEEIVNRNDAKSYVTECINTIRTNILYMNSVKTAKTVLVTSCRAQEGKSWVSSNIATSFAETDKKVLVIDADLRKGRSNKIFNIDNTKGLSDYLCAMTGDIQRDLKLAEEYIKETEIPNLHVLTNGSVPPNPAELLETENMKAFISALKSIYDIIIIDSPPCMLVTDSVILSTIVDSTILVVNSAKTKIKDLLEVRKSIKLVGGNLIGVILNKVKIKGKTYSKSYYYGHAKPDDKCEVKQRDIITVKEVIDSGILKLNLRKEISEDPIDKKEEQVTENNENIVVVNNNNEQKHYLEKMIDIVSSIKLQLDENHNSSEENIKKAKKEIGRIIETINSKIEELKENSSAELSEKFKQIDYLEKIERISHEVKNLNYAEELEEISHEIEKLNYKEELEENIGRLYREIMQMKENNKKIIDEVKDTSYIDAVVQKMSDEKITREEIHDIIKQEMLSRDEMTDIVRQETLSKEEIQNIIDKDKLTIETVQDIIRNEIKNADYSKQFSRLEEMILKLKDSYVEDTKNIDDEQNVDEDNTIDTNIRNVVSINLFKKKKRSYSINEDIEYSDLENSATCVVEFPLVNDSDDTDYQNIIIR